MRELAEVLTRKLAGDLKVCVGPPKSEALGYFVMT
jgi:hypothetical protein